jgi:flagellar L-ring protein precursor FlgH
MKRVIIYLLLIVSLGQPALAAKKPKVVPPSPLEQFLASARQATPAAGASGNSLFTANSPNLFLFHDIKAHALNDLLTIQIVEAASATNSSNTSTQKNTAANLSAPGLFGLEKSTKMDFTKLVQAATGLTFAGQGATSRSGQLQAWVTARVTEVLPNGDLVLEGTKDVIINKEHQVLEIRGVVRQVDVAPANVVPSTAVAHMEVKFGGKGVVTTANDTGFLSWLFNKINLF